MQADPALDVSVIVPFRDDEDVIGTACQRLAAHLSELELGYELLAVDEHSGDNSHAILSLLRGSLPHLRILPGQPGRGHAAGASAARGRVLCVVEPAAATRSLAALGRAHGRVARGELDVAIVRGRFAVARRARAGEVLDSVGGRGAVFERVLLRRAARRGLLVEAYDVGGEPSTGRGLADRLRWRLAVAFGTR